MGKSYAPSIRATLARMPMGSTVALSMSSRQECLMAKLDITHHDFTPTIIEILHHYFGQSAEDILETSPLLGYLNNKTRAANRGSKARGAFANHYALYVVIEDYIKKGFYSYAGRMVRTRPSTSHKRS